MVVDTAAAAVDMAAHLADTTTDPVAVDMAAAAIATAAAAAIATAAAAAAIATATVAATVAATDGIKLSPALESRLADEATNGMMRAVTEKIRS
jgi:hypothetical protein